MTMPPTEAIRFYFERTSDHIKKVRSNMVDILRYTSLIPLDKHEFFIAKAAIHDQSKYSDDELIPYIWFTWHMKPGNNIEVPNDVDFEEAGDHHYGNNPHHPEYYKHLHHMAEYNIIEMVCDWAAMSQEFGTSLEKWISSKVPARWPFTDDQQILIEEAASLFI